MKNWEKVTLFIVLSSCVLLAIGIVAFSKSAGPSKEFLSSKFVTFAGAGTSAELGSVEKFYSDIGGNKSWEKTEAGWILRTEVHDDVTKSTSKSAFVFENSPQDNKIYLTRANVDGLEVPQEGLWLFVSTFQARRNTQPISGTRGGGF